MFWVIKTLHEGAMGDFPREVEGRFFQVGKNVVKKRSVFLHATIRHAAEELECCVFREKMSNRMVGVILGPETVMQMLVSQSVKSRSKQAKHIAMRGTCAYTS